MVRVISSKEKKDLEKRLLELAAIAGKMFGIEDIDLFSDHFYIGTRFKITPSEKRVTVFDSSNMERGVELGAAYESRTGEEWEVYESFD